MSDDMTISRPVEILNNSKERVAFDLMQIIHSRESRAKQEHDDRKYWLILYHQCLNATSGYGLESILKED